MPLNQVPVDDISSSIRSYSGEYLHHAHDHGQIMFALQGRMELEIGGRRRLPTRLAAC